MGLYKFSTTPREAKKPEVELTEKEIELLRDIETKCMEKDINIDEFLTKVYKLKSSV